MDSQHGVNAKLGGSSKLKLGAQSCKENGAQKYDVFLFSVSCLLRVKLLAFHMFFSIIYLDSVLRKNHVAVGRWVVMLGKVD